MTRSRDRAAQPVGSRQLYAYWKTQNIDAALGAARAGQQLLCQRLPGLQTDLLQRENLAETIGTVMEIYRHPEGVTSRMQHEIDGLMQSTLQTWLASPRVVEVFVSPQSDPGLSPET